MGATLQKILVAPILPMARIAGADIGLCLKPAAVVRGWMITISKYCLVPRRRIDSRLLSWAGFSPGVVAKRGASGVIVVKDMIAMK